MIAVKIHSSVSIFAVNLQRALNVPVSMVHTNFQAMDFHAPVSITT